MAAPAETPEITPQVIADCYIARDPQHPGKVAVVQYVARGRHPVVAGGFDDRRSAERWMEFHRGGGARG